MEKIKSLEDLKKHRNNLQAKKEVRERPKHPNSYVLIKVGMGTSGIASGAKEVKQFLKDTLEKRNIRAKVTQAGDMGYSFAEPTIEITKPGEEAIVFGYVDTDKADEIIEKYIKCDELVDGVIPQNYKTIDEQ